MGVFDALGGAALGMITGDRERENQLAQNQGMINQQVAAGMKSTRFNNDEAYKMWLKTGLVGQMKQARETGMNEAMLYGKAGPGGQATSIPGSASGGAEGRNDIQQGMAIALNNQLVKAQKENIEADTNLKEKEAGKAGATTASIELSNQWENFLQGKAEDGTSLKETAYRVDVNKVRSEISKLDEEIKAIPEYLENDNERIQNEVKRIAIEAQNAKTAQERNDITMKIANLERNLRLQMQGNELNEKAKDQGSQQQRHYDMMEQKDQDQLLDTIDSIFSTAIPWYQRRKGTTTTTESYEDGEGGRTTHQTTRGR